MFRTSYLSLLSSLAILANLATVQSQTDQGCYAADASLTSLGSYQYQSEGYCSTQCKATDSAVFAMTDGNECLCGNALPSGGTVSSSLCNLTCSGYPEDICGGDGYYSVWLSGVGTLDGSSASSSSSSTAASSKKTTSSSTTATAAAATPTVIYITTAIVQQGVTVVQTVSASTATSSSSASGTTSESKKSKSSGISGGAIAGIVIGVLALVAIGAGLAFFFYRRRKRDTDDFGGEYKRHIEPAGPIALPAPVLDNRLDTSLAIRRNSSESLADNQDYSRKILRVMN